MTPELAPGVCRKCGRTLTARVTPGGLRLARHRAVAPIHWRAAQRLHVTPSAYCTGRWADPAPTQQETAS